MAFNGSLLKMSGDNFPLKYVYKESYKVTPNRRQDLDPYRDANGLLHRNTLSHTATTIQFQTKPMWNNEFDAMMSFIRARYSNSHEKKIHLTYFSPDINDYKSGDFYVPDVEYVMDLVDTSRRRILYLSTTLEFIEY